MSRESRHRLTLQHYFLERLSRFSVGIIKWWPALLLLLHCSNFHLLWFRFRYLWLITEIALFRWNPVAASHDKNEVSCVPLKPSVGKQKNVNSFTSGEKCTIHHPYAAWLWLHGLHWEPVLLLSSLSFAVSRKSISELLSWFGRGSEFTRERGPARERGGGG